MSIMAVSLSSNNSIKPPLLTLNKQYHFKPQTFLNFHKYPFQLKTISTKPTFCFSQKTQDLAQIDERETNPFLSSSNNGGLGLAPPVIKKRKRYRKEYPGESIGITEEMRFVAMKLRNDNGDKFEGDGEGDGNGGVWEPTMEGFVKYLVDSKLVFETIEAIVEDSNDVAYAYFRRTGLERSDNLARDLVWLSQQGMTIPEPSNPGMSYSSYLKELSEKSAPLFLSHFYNVYFTHIAGGQVIAKQVAEKLLKERQLELFDWKGDEQEFLKEVRQKLNTLSEHWTRDDKNKCLKEATKSYRYLGQIVRLIIL